MANPEQFLQALPAKRIKPADGMSVTADVWRKPTTITGISFGPWPGLGWVTAS
jgi:hypothetical protein